LVLLEPVRSAEPPIVSARAALIASSASSEALRVASFCGAAARLSSHAAMPKPLRQPPCHAADQLGAVGAGGETLLPGGALAGAAPAGLPPGGEDRFGNVEGLAVPHQLLARGGDLVVAQSGAVGSRGALLIGRAPADDRAAADQRRPRVGQRLVDGAADVGGIVAVAGDGVPAIGPVAGENVLGGGEIGGAVDGDAVVVPQDVEAPEAEMAGKARRLVVHPLHQVAVAGDHPGPVIDETVAEPRVQVALGDRHPHRHAEALAERPGGRLDSGEHEVLRMAGAGRAELPEALQVVDRRPLVAGEVEQRVDQHRAVAGREHEAVAVRPGGILRIVLEIFGEQHGGGVGHAHRHAGMARIRRLDRIHRKGADGVGEQSRIGGHGLSRAAERPGGRGGGGGLLEKAPRSPAPLEAEARASTPPLFALVSISASDMIWRAAWGRRE
jgi:hypothetical protein